MVPGMVHCRRGPGAWVTDYVDPLVKWREEGRAPDRIVASRPAEDDGGDNGFTRPLCVYPKLAQYKGDDPAHADSYECK